ncbi:PH domain-containing protein [Amylibacter sp.]|nr:PH domain-containing protein [Amylibacter sp.]
MNNIEKCKKLTQERDWAGLFELNGLEIDSFGTKKELSVLGDYLQKDEVVFALVSGIISQSETSTDFDFGAIGAKNWISALTSERILCLDYAMLSSSINTQSIRLNQIQAVSASQGWFFGQITVDIGAGLIVIDNCEKPHVKVFAELANQLIRQKEEGETLLSGASVSIADEMSKLNDLHIKGVLTADEFSKAKEKLIAKL